jgi:hypothetical protein
MFELIDRAVVVRAMRLFIELVEEAAERHDGAATLASDRILDSLLERACDSCGLARSDYEAALGRAPDLACLQGLSLRSIGIAGADPGPYDRISGRDPADSWLRAHDGG